ncbi:fumarylacetoacetate hydrolase family protein [Crenobacter caeni]|uniref:Fumarylacetoacetate hydrolase family protein n=1 Tax=Crenobacter caeni TaxID=2705474 RepID=A0A6B2KSW8_9NEIS|nr:fumarylacetoacetate hydrolase family protein [Crenobacter caeni]NDV13089.1 fumarylacetoacetate hydrolase family protein [Crenobacter caeni]
MTELDLAGRAVRPANIFCIGRNYAAHAAELGNPVEEEPLVFLKPTSALLPEGQAIVLPAFSSDVHYEAELVLLIGESGNDIAEGDALSHVAGYGLGLDLTCRDVQNAAKARGLPWAKGKGFRGAACVSSFVPAREVADPGRLTFTLDINGERRQTGDTSHMLFPPARLIAYLSSVFGLSAGDLVYTGTPAGVAALKPGDALALELPDLVQASWQVAR